MNWNDAYYEIRIETRGDHVVLRHVTSNGNDEINCGSLGAALSEASKILARAALRWGNEDPGNTHR